MRPQHYLKHNSTSAVPSNFVCVDTETYSAPIGENEVEARLKFGWACYFHRKESGKFTAPDWYRFDTPSKFWHWLKRRTAKKQRVMVYAHNWSFDFTVMKGFDYTVGQRWKMTKSVIEGPPTILAFRKLKRTIVLLDTLNYFRMPLASLGNALGVPKLEMPGEDASTEEWDTYCKNDCDILRQAVEFYVGIVKEWDLGSYQFTLASQAFAAFRHRFMHHKILIDNDPLALAISREAYTGGRVELFHKGKIRRKLYLLDINSQYPYVMSEEEVPTALLTVIRDPSNAELSDILTRRAAVGDVVIKTPEPCVPYVYNSRLIFPTGTFRVCLSSPELLYCLKRGYVHRIYRAAIYERAKVFADYVRFFYGKRLEYEAMGNKELSFACKILLNSLYGKFGQNGRKYISIGDAPDLSARNYIVLDADSGRFEYRRQFAGVEQVLATETESFNSHPAIASHITSAARMLLWRYINIAGRKHVYYCDTDSILVDDSGFSALSSYLDPKRLGHLKLELETSSAELRGCKDYQIGERIKIKGVRRTAEQLNESTFRQPTFVGWRGMLRLGDMGTMRIRQTIKHLTREYRKGTVEASGDIRPYNLTTGDK